MAVKVDLCLAREGKDSGVRTIGGKGGCGGGGKFAGEKGKLRVVEEGPRPDSVTTVSEKKKLKELKEKSWAEAKKLKKLKQAGKEARPRTCNIRKEGHFFWDCNKLDKLWKLSPSTLQNT